MRRGKQACRVHESTISPQSLSMWHFGILKDVYGRWLVWRSRGMIDESSEHASIENKLLEG